MPYYCMSGLGLLIWCAQASVWSFLQAAQVRVMLEAVRTIQQTAGQPSWAVLMGDFNSTPGSAIYRGTPTGFTAHPRGALALSFAVLLPHPEWLCTLHTPLQCPC